MTSTKYKTPLLLLFVFINLLPLAVSLPQGAPESSCQSLLPIHGGGILPLTTASLFRIIPSSETVGQGQSLKIEIQSTIPELSFKGFMIHALTANPPYRVVGRFETSTGGLVKLINCEGEEDTATHSNTSPKVNFALEWQSPTDYIGDIIFNATIAQDYDKFWVGETSDRVQVVPQDQVRPLNGISTTRRPIQSTTPNFVKPLVQANSNKDTFYDGCGENKTCFGNPDNCVETQSCQTVTAVLVRGERYIFEMRSNNRAAYVAIGLSEDNKMGKDSVIECVNEAGSIKAYSSWTEVALGKFDAVRDVPQNTIRLLEGRYENGIIYCQVEKDPVTSVNGIKFDLISDKHYLLLASGSSLRASTVDYHDIVRSSSQQSLKLSEVRNVVGKSKVLLRLHGAMMIIAWIGTTSIGILLARYFKQTWVTSSLCGKDQWFAWHRICMVFTWILTIAAFIIIFVEIGEWSKVQNPHAILGTITTVLCFIQPIGAFFRPSPGSNKRPIFNWMHWLGGNVAHILAIVTIFFAVKLGKAELPEWIDFILVAYVVFHVLIHLLLSISGCISDRKGNQRVSSFPMADMNQSRNQMIANTKQDAAFSGFRKVLLSIYVVVIILFVIALVIIAVLAPIESSVESFKSKIIN
ncbi:unnamed protein product [Diamesa serratosioi]